jgi:hypothetical protein
MYRKLRSYLSTMPAEGASLLSAVSGRAIPSHSEGHYDTDPQGWGTSYSDIIDHPRFAAIEPLVSAMTPAEANEYDRKEMKKAFEFMDKTLEADVKGITLFSMPGGGRDSFLGMGHDELVEWAASGHMLPIPEGTTSVDGGQFVATMLAHGITLPQFVARTTLGLRHVLQQLTLTPQMLIAWGLSLRLLLRTLCDNQLAGSILDISVLNHELREAGHPQSISAWVLPDCSASLFTRDVLYKIDNNAWKELGITIPALFALGLDPQTIPREWIDYPHLAPPHACLTERVLKVFGLRKVVKVSRHNAVGGKWRKARRK